MCEISTILSEWIAISLGHPDCIENFTANNRNPQICYTNFPALGFSGTIVQKQVCKCDFSSAGVSIAFLSS